MMAMPARGICSLMEGAVDSNAGQNCINKTWKERNLSIFYEIRIQQKEPVWKLERRVVQSLSRV